MSLQLTADVARFIGYDADGLRSLRAPARSVAFLARGPGVCRVVSTFHSATLLAQETALDRYMASARVSGKQIFHLPRAVVRHLGLELRGSGTGKNPSTDDIVLWIVGSSEYYGSLPRWGSEGPPAGEIPRDIQVYLTRSRVPLSLNLRQYEGLDGAHPPGGLGFPAAGSPM